MATKSAPAPETCERAAQTENAVSDDSNNHKATDDQSEKIKAMQKEIDELRESNDNNKATDDQNEKVKAMQNELDELGERNDNNKATDDQSEKVKAMQSELDELRDRNDNNNATDDQSEKVKAMQNELDELRERNETLEEYYDINSRKTNEKFKLTSENQKLTTQVKSLREQVQSHKHKNQGMASELATYKQMYAAAVAAQQKSIRSGDCEHKTCDHLCYTAGGCSVKTKQNLAKNASIEGDAVIQDKVQKKSSNT